VADSDVLDQARALLRGASHGALATLDRNDGAPVATLVAFASDRDASPLLLLSDLAEHTKNLAGDPRASLLIDGTQGLAERLTGPRLTVIGRLERCDSTAALERYFRRHPGSAMLRDFADFHLYRLVVERAHQVAGFGRIDAIAGADLTVATELLRDLAGMEAGAIAHMHDDHQDALDLLAGARAGQQAQLTGIDADGLDLSIGEEPHRAAFATRLGCASDLRAAIAALTRAVREKSAENNAG
jgi:putative heme iron utilization protein